MDHKPDPNDELTEQDWEEMRKRDAEIDAAFSVAPAELRAAYNSANRICEVLTADKANIAKNLDLLDFAVNIAYNLEEYAIALKEKKQEKTVKMLSWYLKAKGKATAGGRAPLHPCAPASAIFR